MTRPSISDPMRWSRREPGSSEWRRLLGDLERRLDDDPEVPDVPLLRGGSAVRLVGESFHQETLASICGPPNEDGYQYLCWAVLVAEPDNPYDRNAVGVLIDGRKVGNIDRGLAVELQTALLAIGGTGRCWAVVRGGWDRGGGDVGMFGVTIDLTANGPLLHDPPE